MKIEIPGWLEAALLYGMFILGFSIGMNQRKVVAIKQLMSEALLAKDAEIIEF